MSDIAIRASGLGKQYQIGAVRRRSDSLRDALTRSARAAVTRLGGRAVQPTSAKVWALRDVSFEVRRGEVLGVIGQNGAGKSTLLKILSRITEPTTGEAELHGRVGSLLEVGTGFHPELTGRENIFLNGAILGMQRREVQRKFDEIVDFSGVEAFIDTPVKRYSSGMYMRLAFAVAAHMEQEILIVDEVLAVGDAEFQKKCLGRISTVAQGGRTVLFVSHNMQPIQELCGRLLWLHGGRLMADGDVGAVMHQKARHQAGTADMVYNGYSVRVELADGAGMPLTAWQTDALLRLRVTVRGPANQELPAVDVACYTVSGAWLFSLQSDMFAGASKTRIGRDITLEFAVTNTAIATCEAYFDVGVRPHGSGQYAALFQRAQFVSIVSTPQRQYSRARPLLTLPASVRIAEID